MKIKYFNFKSVTSTNNVALKLIKEKKIKPSLISAEIQTKGRGTMGKKWVSQKGNIFISFFFEINQKKINFKQYAILNASILKNFISKLIKKKIRIKWPNDLIYNKDKICGILQEVISINKKDFLIVGIGLNTNNIPKNKSFPSSSLKNIIKKDLDNKIVIQKIKKEYEEFLTDTKKYSYLALKKKYK